MIKGTQMKEEGIVRGRRKSLDFVQHKIDQWSCKGIDGTRIEFVDIVGQIHRTHEGNPSLSTNNP